MCAKWMIPLQSPMGPQGESTNYMIQNQLSLHANLFCLFGYNFSKQFDLFF